MSRFAGLDLRRALRIDGQRGLALWFVLWSWVSVGLYFDNFPRHMEMLGFDARIYLHAAQTWLAGGDPWTSYVLQHSWTPGVPDVPYYFAGPPPTVLAFSPFAWLADGVFTAGWEALTIGAAFYTLRRLHLPAWWILFPPMLQAVFVGNPHVVCLSLIVSGSTVLQALAPAAKAYAVIPMIAERQWRAVALFTTAAALSVAILWPLWSQYVKDYPQIQAWITTVTGGGYSAARDPRLFAVVGTALAGLWLVDRRAAGWLAVPALWPAAEYFYATFAMPLRSPWLMAFLAFPGSATAFFAPWTFAAYAVVRLAMELRRRPKVSPRAL